MFEFIQYIYDFWNGLLTKLNTLIGADMTLITYTVGTQTLSLFDILEMILVFLTTMYAVKITYKFFKSLYRIARKTFSP